MILCHKCQGLLAHEETENVAGLLGCQCISGYVRGFEKQHTRLTAVSAQIKQQREWITLYESQKREPEWIEDRLVKIKALEALLMD